MRNIKIIEIWPDGSLNINYKNFYGINCFNIQEENYTGFPLHNKIKQQDNTLLPTDALKIEKEPQPFIAYKKVNN